MRVDKYVIMNIKDGMCVLIILTKNPQAQTNKIVIVRFQQSNFMRWKWNPNKHLLTLHNYLKELS